jgi:hypothetical protein
VRPANLLKNRPSSLRISEYPERRDISRPPASQLPAAAPTPGFALGGRLLPLDRRIGDNPGMRRRGLPLVMIVVLVAGCAGKDEPQPRAANPPPSASPATVRTPIAKRQADGERRESKIGKPQAENGKLPAGQTGYSHDQFDLPLVIHVDVPEVPPEIEKPSPPIKEKPEQPAEGFNLFRWFQQKPKPP